MSTQGEAYDRAWSDRIAAEAADEQASQPVTSSETSEKGEELIAAVDAIIDEIDAVLEDNPEEFVYSYRQRGGE